MKANYKKVSRFDMNCFNPIKKVLLVCVFFLFTFSQKAQVLVPFSGSNNIACGTNTVLQDHSGYVLYANNANGFTVIDCGFNAAISINGNYITESGFDYVRIYNGVGTGGAMLLNVSGTGNINYAGTPGQTLTVQYITDGSVVMQGFNLNISFSGNCFSSPCAGMPYVNTIMPQSYTTCVGLNNPGFYFPSSYTLGGLTYQWQSSTLSPVGPFNSIPGYTLATMPTFTVNTTTWYQAVVTCTISQLSTSITAGPLYIVGTVTNTVPYFEDFESIPANDRMPNCSWAVSNTVTCKTYTAANTLGRLPYSGAKFASFFLNPTGTKYYYTNGIWMEPGITYSASMKYRTDLTGAANWSNLAILTGTTQAPASLAVIASVSGAAISPVHSSLSNTFTVPAPALYYVAIRATSSTGVAQYLSWDDLSIIIPCTTLLNSPNLTLNTPTTTICSGAAVNIVASGADTYTWNTGSTSSTINYSPTVSTYYEVSGTNLLTGCTATTFVFINVKPSPVVSALATPGTVCSGKTVNLAASGAATYTWNNSATGPNTTANPTGPTSYTVIGKNSNGCTGKASVNVLVNSLPSVSAFASSQICRCEPEQLSGNGAVTYTWVSNTGLVLQGSSPLAFNLQPGQASFTVTGSDANGCPGIATANVFVEPCVGINKVTTTANGVKLYPNPNGGELTIELKDANHTVEITDMTGRVVLSEYAGTEITKINVSAFATGVYFVKVKSGAGTEVIKVIKE